MNTLNEKYKGGGGRSNAKTFFFKGLQKIKKNWQQSFTTCCMEEHIFLCFVSK